MKAPKLVVIAKRDGTLERFSLVKLGNCLALALRQYAYDPRLSGPLAKAVAMHLQEWRAAQPPSTDYIYGCVQAVLQQTGLGEVADGLKAHRRRRRVRRDQLRVVDGDLRAAPGQPWSKTRLVATLQNGCGLRQAVSRFLAGRIEANVFVLGYRIVTNTFLRELVRNEVLAWGLADEPVWPTRVSTLPRPVGAPQPNEED